MNRSPRGLAGLGVAAMAAVLLVERLYNVDATARVDVRALEIAEGWRGGPTGRLVEAVTLLGSAPGLIPVAAAAALVAGRRGRWRRALLPFLVLGAADLCNLTLKRIARRQRPPCDPPLVCRTAWDHYAFPSGHAMNSAALFGLLVLWVLGSLRGLGALAAAASLTLLPLLVGLSRVALRVHWLSDVVAGWLAGVAVMSLVTALSCRLLEQRLR